MGTPRRVLKDFTRLFVGFFCCLIILSLYQQIRLFLDGVIDIVIGKSFFLLLVHQLGFTAIASLLLAFVYNGLENKKTNLGFRAVYMVFFSLLIFEALLIEYYVENYEVLGIDIRNLEMDGRQLVLYALKALVFGLSILFCFRFFYRVSAFIYSIAGKMYPVTIFLFSLFLLTILSEKSPINENKVQFLITDVFHTTFNEPQYSGGLEYPLLKAYQPHNGLSPYFDFDDSMPNLVVIMVEGLGHDFIGAHKKYRYFTPFLNELERQSLSWQHHLSNSGATVSAMTSLVGSLPFGKMGFTHLDEPINRNTLFTELRKNGYKTAFYYGGNSALGKLDKFLQEEQLELVVDRTKFGKKYTALPPDAAGISIGFADGDLIRKWDELFVANEQRRIEFFLTQCSKKPFKIPNQESYLEKVDGIVKRYIADKPSKRTINKNKNVFASFLYTDDALRQLMEYYKNDKHFKNTLFIITGTHYSASLPQKNNLERYRVPFLMYSPMLKSPHSFNHITSHMDVAPALTNLLSTSFAYQTDTYSSWLGVGLAKNERPNKQIPLLRKKGTHRDYIFGGYFLSSGSAKKLSDYLHVPDLSTEAQRRTIRDQFKNFRAINHFVTANDRLVPDSLNRAFFERQKFTKEETIWISSVFNGKDFDNAYNTARELAHEGNHERALLLCSFILSKVPGHVDTQILKGRINAWNGNYKKSMVILNEVIQKNPTYEDGYAALLDVYYWSNNNSLTGQLYETLAKQHLETNTLLQKVERNFAKIDSPDITKTLVQTATEAK